MISLYISLFLWFFIILECFIKNDLKTKQKRQDAYLKTGQFPESDIVLPLLKIQSYSSFIASATIS